MNPFACNGTAIAIQKKADKLVKSIIDNYI